VKYEVLVIEEMRHTVRIDVDDPAKASAAALIVVNLDGIEDDRSPSTLRVVSRRRLDSTGPNTRISPDPKAKVHAQYLGQPDRPLCSARPQSDWVEQTSDPVNCESCLNIEAGRGRAGNTPAVHAQE
jgi:hypothetical protein